VRLRRVILTASASLALVTPAFLACSSDSRSQSTGDALDAGTPEAAVIEVEEASAPPPAGYDGGVGLGLVDVADTACSPRGGPLAVVLPGVDASPRPAFRSLQRAGDRRIADDFDGTSFVVFSADGSGGTRVATAPLAGAASTILGSQIVVGGRSGQNFDRAIVQTYDASGAASGSPVVLANEYPSSVGILAAGADDKTALVAWTTPAGVRARGFAGTAAAGDSAYTLAVTSKLHDPTSLVVSSVQSGLFAVVFSGNDGGSLHQTAFGRGSATERIGDPSNLFTGEVARTVVGLARTPSGFALLVTVNDGANPYAMLVLTDAGGRRKSAGLKLLGTTAASGLAVTGSEIAVLALRREGTAFESKTAMELRAFDLSGAPIAPWVCLEPPGSARIAGGGIVAESNGYAALFQASDGSTSLARFDHVGTGAP
jgi:hypothetical protein